MQLLYAAVSLLALATSGSAVGLADESDGTCCSSRRSAGLHDKVGHEYASNRVR